MIQTLDSMDAQRHSAKEDNDQRKVHSLKTHNAVTTRCHSKDTLPVLSKQPAETAPRPPRGPGNRRVNVNLPPRERGGFRGLGTGARRVKVTLPPRERGGLRGLASGARGVKLMLPPRERGGIWGLGTGARRVQVRLPQWTNPVGNETTWTDYAAFQSRTAQLLLGLQTFAVMAEGSRVYLGASGPTPTTHPQAFTRFRTRRFAEEAERLPAAGLRWYT